MRSITIVFLSIITLFGAAGGFTISPHAKPEYQFRVAIIDRFYPSGQQFSSTDERTDHGWIYGLVDLDHDEQKETYYHGDLVEMIARHPAVNTIAYPIFDNVHPMQSILANLNKIIARQSVQPIDAVILSWESSTLASSFTPPLSHRHSERYIAEIKQWAETQPSWLTTYKIIRALEELTDQGVRVYTIAGNSGRRMINTFSFARGVITVGASEAGLSHIAQNPFVDTTAPAVYYFTRLDDPSGNPIGYDINDDGCVDIPVENLTNSNQTNSLPEKHWQPLVGTSFAAPAALHESLNASKSDNTGICEPRRRYL